MHSAEKYEGQKQAFNFHLFNCDNTFNLKEVETFLLEVKDEYGFDISVTPHYFRLSQMSELYSSKIPKLSMDFAVFVVHANESRLSINEDNAGIGYSKIYRALMKATGNKVLIVIGEDDNYTDEEEKNLAYLSRWAWRKVASQFDRKFMDGTEGFIFSWGKKHRSIHKEALCHFLDQNKAGQKFVAQPKKEKERPQVMQDTVHIQENHDQEKIHIQENCHQEKMHFQENYNEEESQKTKEEAEESFEENFDMLPELRAKGNKVLIVIGEDDNYTDEEEKNLAYLSRWAWRKVASQFDRKFMDGTEGFIFSWRKKHRSIHKESLCHFLDQNKAGQKFVAQPREERERSQDEQDTVHIQENHDQEKIHIQDNCHQEKIHFQENHYQEESQKTKEEAEESFEENFDMLPELRAKGAHPSGTILLETYLRYGKISYEAEDVARWDHKWHPPNIVEQNLEREWRATPSATVRFVADRFGIKLKIIDHTSPWLRPLIYIYDLLWNLLWNGELEKDGGAP